MTCIPCRYPVEPAASGLRLPLVAGAGVVVVVVEAPAIVPHEGEESVIVVPCSAHDCDWPCQCPACKPQMHPETITPSQGQQQRQPSLNELARRRWHRLGRIQAALGVPRDDWHDALSRLVDRLTADLADAVTGGGTKAGDVNKLSADLAAAERALALYEAAKDNAAAVGLRIMLGCLSVLPAILAAEYPQHEGGGVVGDAIRQSDPAALITLIH